MTDNSSSQSGQAGGGFSFPPSVVPVVETVATPPPLPPNEPVGATTSQSSQNLRSGPASVVDAPPVSGPTPLPVMSQGGEVNPPPTMPLGIKVTEQKTKSKSKDVFMVGLLLVLLAGAVFGFTKVRSLLSSAAEDGCAPISVTEQDLTSNSIVVQFTTKEACKMQIAYGVDEVLGLQLSEQIASTDHRIKLTPLMPSTPYRYQIRSGDDKYEPTRGFLTLAAAVSPAPTKTPTAVPTVATPAADQTATGSSSTKYTLEDFQVHFGSVDPRFDTDKNGTVNIRDWQLYSK